MSPKILKIGIRKSAKSGLAGVGIWIWFGAGQRGTEHGGGRLHHLVHPRVPPQALPL